MSVRHVETILLAAARPLERLAISAVLKTAFSGGSVHGVADYDSLNKVLDSATSLAVLDLDLPGLGSLTDILRLHVKYPKTKIVVMSANCSLDSAMSILSAGAQGYLPKTLPQEELIAAFRLVAAGQVFVPRQICEPPTFSGTHRREGHLPGGHHLSERQRQVLRLASEGKSNKEIGRELQIAEATVKVHISAAFRTMGVNNRARAVAAFRQFDDGQGTLRLTG